MKPPTPLAVTPAPIPPTENSADSTGVAEADRRKAAADRRRAEVERRNGVDRRKGGSAFDRNRGPGRRRTDYRRDAEEGHMNEEQLEFIRAVDEYKRVNDRPFPTLTEVLDLLLYLGYRKVAPVGEFKLCKGRQHPLKGAPDDEADADGAEE